MLFKTYILFVSLLCVFICCDTATVDTVLKSDLPDTVFVTTVSVDTIIEYRVQEKSKGEVLVDTLRSYLGAKESPSGSNRGALVDRFFRWCKIDPGVPWCGCFANYGVVSVGGTGPNAPAWSPSWGKKEKITWLRDKDPIDVKFMAGWQFGIYFRSLNRVSHIGTIAEDFGDGYVLTIEGNTNSAGGREGNGVYLRIRHKSEIFFCSYWL